MAFSSIIKGAGIVAAGPYYCAKGNLTNAFTVCMTMPALINYRELAAATLLFADSGVIDPLHNVMKQRVFLFSGTWDSVVHPGVVEKLAQYYAAIGIPKENIEMNFDVPAQHSIVSDDFGNWCKILGEPFINNCGFSVAGAILNSTYGDMNPPEEPLSGNLLSFSQDEYGKAPGLAPQGFVYVPSSCQSGKRCRLHIAFHGCQQEHERVGDAFVAHAGYNKYAESNDIIVLYPQSKATPLFPANRMFSTFWPECVSVCMIYLLTSCHCSECMF